MSAAATLQGDLGPTVTSADGEMSTADVMVGKQYVGLYFSAHWCPPCRDFTPMLADWYTANATDLELELVFVSSDNDEEGFTEYFNEMPWKALPYSATVEVTFTDGTNWTQVQSGEYAGTSYLSLDSYYTGYVKNVTSCV